MTLGWRVFGLGIMALALVGLVVGDFNGTQPVPKDFPARTVLAYAAGGFMLAAGAGMQWRRTAAWAAAALAVYCTFVVVLLMCGRSILRHAAEPLAYTNTAEPVAIAAGAWMVFAWFATIDAKLAGRLMHAGRIVFGLCAVVFGLAHFLFMNMTAPLVPKWLPLGGAFWGYATGVFHIAGGLALISGLQARLAAILLTVMYAAFTPLALLPLLLSDPHSVGAWGENAVNIALVGVAWVAADTLRRRESSPGG